MVRIEFYSLLRLLLKQEKLELQAITDETINQLLQRVQKKLPTPFLHKLLDEQGALILEPSLWLTAATFFISMN